ncbi:hypothetical protein Mapa_003803 [Marchantia paleacea]|nr:hypothetical protein Mapa_003803 [Marchantia paleacea]
MEKMYRVSGLRVLQVVLFFFLVTWSPVVMGDDLQALLDFKSQLIDPSGSLATWNGSNVRYCDWFGVVCDTPTSRVTKLHLNASGLSGSISPSIGSLAFLETIDLSANQLSGVIPREVSGLSNLTKLGLFQNDFSGEIPSDLGISGRLEHVDLSANRLTGPFPPAICFSEKLTLLSLYNNSLKGLVPQNISLCRRLQRLLLADNEFQGQIPESIGSLENLSILDLSSNNFVGPMPSNFSQSISYLSLRDNQLSGTLGIHWDRLKNLTLLSLGSNNLSGQIPLELGELEGLNTLHLAHNKFEGPIPVTLSQIRLLDILDLSSNNLVGEIPKEIGNLDNLSSLILEDNNLSGPIPAELEGCVKLIELEIANNNLSGVIPPQIGRLTNLQYGLNLSFNSLSGPIPKELGNLTKLTKLDLSHNLLEGPVPASLGDLPSLLYIDLSYNKLNGTVPPFKTPVNETQFAHNRDLCFVSCVGSDGGSGRNGSGLPTWAAIVIGIGVALALLVLGGVIACYLRNQVQYYPTEGEPKVQSTEGRLFVDPERENFTFEGVLDATLMINENHLIGRGRFSSVYRVVLPNGLELAIKKLKVDTENSVLSRKFVSELVKVDKMRHHNILRILGFVLRGDSLLLLYDYMPNGSLGEWLHRRPEAVLEWSTRYRVAVGSAQGLAYLHHNCHPPFVHRDINSNNVLLDAAFEPHLGDVGLAKLYDPSKDTESMTAVAGSFGYIAPEYAYTMRVTEKSNVYSFGVVLLEMLTGRDPVERTFGEGLDLVSWVHTAAEREETPEQILDPAVSTASFHVRQEMLSVLKVAKLCTSTLPSERPKMKAVVEMLYKSKQTAVQPFQIGSLQ